MGLQGGYWTGSSTCSVEGCARRVRSKGYCEAHYLRVLKNGDPGSAPIRTATAAPGVCSVEGCDRPAKARGWCGSHYARWLSSGNTGPAFKKPFERRATDWGRLRAESQAPAAKAPPAQRSYRTDWSKLRPPGWQDS